MRVRFSPDIFRTQRYGGVSRYVVEVHRGLRVRDVDSRIVAGLHRNALLHDLDHVWGIDVDRLRPERARQGLTKVADRAVSALATRRCPPTTVWHMSYLGWDLPRRAPLAVTVHDMIHERFPDEVGTSDRSSELKRRACAAADVIFTNSRNTADDLQQRFGVDGDRIVVTPLGVTVVDPRDPTTPFAGRPIVLSVGSRRPTYKNWTALLDAVAGLDPEVTLVCFGAAEDQVDHREVTDRGLSGRVAFVSGDDAELAGWYRAASVLAYPSLYEGFGLPPLEALAHGCPVVATDVGAVPEVVGGVAHLVTPDADDLRAGLADVLADGADQRRAGPGHAAGFTWQATADATLDGYRRLL